MSRYTWLYVVGGVAAVAALLALVLTGSSAPVLVTAVLFGIAYLVVDRLSRKDVVHPPADVVD